MKYYIRKNKDTFINAQWLIKDKIKDKIKDLINDYIYAIKTL